MNVNKNIYPDIEQKTNLTFTKNITEIIPYNEYLEKSIFYCGCKNQYLNFYSPNNIKRTRTGDDFKVEFTKSAEYTKHDIVLSSSQYTGALTGYYGDSWDNGYYGADNTLVNNFKFNDVYLNLDDIILTTIDFSGANRNDTDVNDYIHNYRLSEYLTLESKPLIYGFSNIYFSHGDSGFNVSPLLCRQNYCSTVYTPSIIGARPSTYYYITERAYSLEQVGSKFYPITGNAGNSNNTSLEWHKNDSDVDIPYLSLVGDVTDCEIFAYGANARSNNFYCPVDYDTDNYAMPWFYYSDGWICNTYFAYSFDYFLKMIASTGVRFKLNNIMYASEIDKNGYTTGRYVPLSDLPNSDFYNKEWVDSENSTYDSEYEPDAPIDNDLENIGLNENTGNSKFVRWYALTPTEINALQDWLNSDEREVGYNPMQNIIGVAEYMFDLNEIAYLVGTSNIKIGTETYGGFGTPQVASLITNITRTFNLGSVTINRYNNDFTDFAPYSTYDIYIPYCGWCHIDSDIAVGNTVDVKLIIDPITSSCKGICLVNGNIIAEINGTIGNTIPISSNNIGQYKQALLSNALSIGSGVVATATGIASGNAVGAVSGGLSLISGVAQNVALKHTSFTECKGNTSTSTMYNTYDRCVLVETHPVEYISNGYAHSIGYVTNETKSISECDGFIVCENVDTSGLSCTETEKQMIKSMLETGCYI